MSDTELSKEPTVDAAEFGAFFPSPYSLSQYTSPKSNLANADYPAPYRGDKKILVIAADERYLPMANGTLFSTGNHPVETLLPMYHMRQAGFDFDIATVSGELAKFEYWAMPNEDAAITGLYREYQDKFRNPMKLSDALAGLDHGGVYAGLFIPGGHGALIGLPENADVAAAIRATMNNDLHLISICHGPAAFLALAADGGENMLQGYSITAFPDAADKMTPDIGYMPGHLTWFFGEKLKAMGMNIINDGISGATHRDRKVVTGDSPFAANALGRLAADALLEEHAG